MRTASCLAAVVLLIACGQADAPAKNGRSADAAAADNLIECRSGGARFERVCTVDRGESAAGPTLIVRKPDGGFRRLLVAADGRGVVAADGAERTRVTILPGNRIEVEIGGDRFRLPATVQRR